MRRYQPITADNVRGAWRFNDIEEPAAANVKAHLRQAGTAYPHETRDSRNSSAAESLRQHVRHQIGVLPDHPDGISA
jgi:hypothetical protein